MLCIVIFLGVHISDSDHMRPQTKDSSFYFWECSPRKYISSWRQKVRYNKIQDRLNQQMLCAWKYACALGVYKEPMWAYILCIRSKVADDEHVVLITFTRDLCISWIVDVYQEGAIGIITYFASSEIIIKISEKLCYPNDRVVYLRSWVKAGDSKYGGDLWMLTHFEMAFY